MNILLAFISALAFCATFMWVSRDSLFFEPLVLMTRGAVYLNFALAVFNLIPIPPLDGSKIVESFLSYPAQQKYLEIGYYGQFVLLALVFSGAMRIIAYPVIFFAELTLSFALKLFGV
jgi:Zn-dependent protease